MLLIRKNTKLKAIHNCWDWIHRYSVVVAYTQKYKIESNSQHLTISSANSWSCCLYAKIQNWKQFTTSEPLLSPCIMLLLIRKNTKLKAIHNCDYFMILWDIVVAYTQKYKIESNSQLLLLLLLLVNVVAYTQKYKIESNSQPSSSAVTSWKCCCLYAKIQNWKQFTTTELFETIARKLLLIRKNTKLKAIHNYSLLQVS